MTSFVADVEFVMLAPAHKTASPPLAITLPDMDERAASETDAPAVRVPVEFPTKPSVFRTEVAVPENDAEVKMSMSRPACTAPGNAPKAEIDTSRIA